MTTDDVTPPGETTTEYKALLSSQTWATVLKICGIVMTFGGVIYGVLTSLLSSNPSNTTLAMLVMIVGAVKFVSGALLKASTTNTYTSTRADVKISALDAIATLQAPPAKVAA